MLNWEEAGTYSLTGCFFFSSPAARSHGCVTICGRAGKTFLRHSSGDLGTAEAGRGASNAGEDRYLSGVCLAAARRDGGEAGRQMER